MIASMRAGVLLLLLAVPARAEPASCGELKPQRSGAMSVYSQKRFPNASAYEAEKPAGWKVLKVTLVIDRAPHIARAALASCPGIHIVDAIKFDDNLRTSYLHVTVDSFAALSRVAQLPAVRSVSVSDPRRTFEFEDPLL